MKMAEFHIQSFGTFATHFRVEKGGVGKIQCSHLSDDIVVIEGYDVMIRIDRLSDSVMRVTLLRSRENDPEVPW